MNLCQCGCGNEVKEGKKYIHGHNIRNNPEHALAVSKALTGIPWTEQHIKNAVAGRRAKSGYIPTERTRNKMRISALNDIDNKGRYKVGHITNNEIRNKISETLKEGYNTGELKSWNDGLTSETCEKIKQMSEKTGKTLKEHYEKGLIKHWAKDQTKETNLSIKHAAMLKQNIPRSEDTREKIKNSDYHKNLKGENNPMFGKKWSTELRKRMAITNSGKGKGRKYSSDSKRKMRESTIRRIEIQKFNGNPMMPRIGGYETQILNYIEQILNIKIQRQCKIAGYFLDGYCPERNLAFEVDEKGHYDIDGKLYEDDIIRQQEIQKELGCNFIRVNDKFVNLITKMEV